MQEIHLTWKHFWLAFFLLFTGLSTQAKAEDWQLRRGDRQRILSKRWSEILQKSPFSRKAFRELLRLYKKPAARRSLYERWKSAYTQNPRRLSSAIIHARALQHQGNYSKALEIWKSVAERYRDKQKPLLRIASVYLALKQPREAVATFQKLLPLVNERQRTTLLLQILEVALKSRDAGALAWIKPQIDKATWSSNQQQQIAQLYEQHQYWAEATVILRKQLERSKGGERLRLMLRLSRLEMNQKHYAAALKLVKEARKVGTLHAWMRWELLEREAEVYRQQKLLGPFARRLARKWRKSKDPRELMFLARLYREDKQDAEAMSLARRVLKIKASLREPRLWLLEYHTKTQEFDEVNTHLQALVKYGHARASHMLQLVDALLRRAGTPLKGRWTPIQLIQNNSRYRRYGSFYYRRRYRRYRRATGSQWTAQKIRESIQAWEKERKQEWDNWKRYATHREEKDFRAAKKLLAQTLQRYGKDWDTVQKLERLADQIGEKNLARRAMRALERAIEADPIQLRYMHVTFLQTQRESNLRTLAKRALKPSLAPLQAVLASAWALRPWDELRGSYRKMTIFAKESQQKSWQRQLCPAIVRTLRLGKSAKQRSLISSLRPVLRLQIYALRWHCGARGNKLREQLHLAEEALLQESEGAQKLLEVYVRSRLDQPLREYLKRRALASKPHELIEMFRPLLQGPWAKQATDSLFAAFAGEESEEHQKARAEALLLLCQKRAQCHHVAQAITTLVRRPPQPITPLLKVLEKVSQYQLFPQERAEWLSALQLRYNNNLPIQHFFATHKALYQVTYNASITYANMRLLRQDLAKVWIKATIQSLALRETEPADLAVWQTSMRQMLYQLQTFHQARDSFFLQLLQAAHRFPAIHRMLILQAVGLYPYRKALQKLLTQIFDHPLQWEDLPWLEQIYRTITPNDRNNALQHLLSKEQSYETLRLIAYLATRYNQTPLRLQALEKMIKLRPKDQALLYKTALLLDRLGHGLRAEALWMRYLASQPEKRRPAYLEQLSQRCCVDANDRALARRILHLSLEKNGLAAIWKPFQRLLPQLDPTQQRTLIDYIAQTPKVPPTSLRQLAELSRQKGFTNASIQLYQRLLKESPKDLSIHLQLGQLYDQQGQHKEAHQSWLLGLPTQTTAQREAFFLKQAQTHTQKGHLNLAAVSYYRAYKTQPPLDQATLRERIAALIRNQKPVQAWGYWLMIGQHADQCLVPQTKHQDFSTTTLPTQLWKANIPYTGTLFSFSRCHWMLTHTQQRESMRHLADFLKQSPQKKLRLRASVEPNEPDATFLVQQRLQTLQDLLLQFGVKKEQLELTQLATKGLCDKDDNLITEHGISCNAFRRQAAVGEGVTDYLQFLSADVDGDKVPDIQDQCPLLQEHAYPQRRLSYTYRRRLGILGSPTPSAPQKGVRGCPPNHNQQLFFQKLQGNVLQMRIPLAFQGYSYNVPYAQRQVVGQLAALLRAAPSLGKLVVELTPIVPQQAQPPQNPSRRYYGRYRYRRYRRYNHYRDPKVLSQRRLNALAQLFRSYKAPMERIKLIQKAPIKRVGASYYTSPEIVLRFEATPSSPSKTKSYPIHHDGTAIPL